MIHWKPNKYADLYYLFILLWILLLMLKTLCCLLFLWKQLGNSDTFFFAYISEYFECYILHSKLPQTEKECGTKTSGESYSYDIIVCLTNYMSDWNISVWLCLFSLSARCFSNKAPELTLYFSRMSETKASREIKSESRRNLGDKVLSHMGFVSTIQRFFCSIWVWS